MEVETRAGLIAAPVAANDRSSRRETGTHREMATDAHKKEPSGPYDWTSGSNSAEEPARERAPAQSRLTSTSATRSTAEGFVDLDGDNVPLVPRMTGELEEPGRFTDGCIMSEASKPRLVIEGETTDAEELAVIVRRRLRRNWRRGTRDRREERTDGNAQGEGRGLGGTHKSPPRSNLGLPTNKSLHNI